MTLEIPVDRALTDDELEAAMIQVLLNHGGYAAGLQNPEEMLDKLGIRDGSIKNKIKEANGGPEAWDMKFLATLWRWVGVGLLVNRGPEFLLAPGSRELLEEHADEAEVVLHRSGLVRRLRDRCPNLDPVTERYAAFAQDCFFAGHYQATAVMIGVASEAALVHFVPRCEAVLTTLSLNPPTRTSEQAAALVRWIDATVAQHRNPLRQAVESVGEHNWIHELPALLGGPATGIRLTRNQAGHPTAYSVSRDECRNMLGLFPLLAEALFVSANAFDRIVAGP